MFFVVLLTAWAMINAADVGLYLTQLVSIILIAVVASTTAVLLLPFL